MDTDACTQMRGRVGACADYDRHGCLNLEEGHLHANSAFHQAVLCGFVLLRSVHVCLRACHGFKTVSQDLNKCETCHHSASRQAMRGENFPWGHCVGLNNPTQVAIKTNLGDTHPTGGQNAKWQGLRPPELLPGATSMQWTRGSTCGSLATGELCVINIAR